MKTKKMNSIEKLEEKYCQYGKNNRGLVITKNDKKPKYTIRYRVWHCDYECYHWFHLKTRDFNSLKAIDEFLKNMPIYGEED